MNYYQIAKKKVTVCLVLFVLLSGCEMGRDHGPDAKYKGVLYVEFAGQEREFLVGRYNDLTTCGEVVDFELKHTQGNRVWIRPDWGYLDVTPTENWHEVQVSGGACVRRE